MFMHVDNLGCMNKCNTISGEIMLCQEWCCLRLITNQYEMGLPTVFDILFSTIQYFGRGKIATHYIQSYLHELPKIKNPSSRQSAGYGFDKKVFYAYFLTGEVSATT